MAKTIGFSFTLPDLHNWKTTSAGWASGFGIVIANKAAFLATHPDKLHCGAILLVAGAAVALGTASHDAGTPSRSTLEVVEDMINAAQPRDIAPVIIDPTVPPAGGAS